MLKRGPTAKFMPNSVVFPGMFSVDQIRFDYPFPGGLVEVDTDAGFPVAKSNYEQNDEDTGICLNGFKNDFPLRVAAARELFEEAGLLLTMDCNVRECKAVTTDDDASLNEWRKKVRESPQKFSELFNSSLKLDVDGLIPWYPLLNTEGC